MADPTNSDLVSFINQGFKPGDLDRVGRTLRAEILERVDQAATISGNTYTKTETDALLANKASLSGATFSGAVTASGTFTATSGVFITNLIDAVDDTAAQASGVAVGELYRTGSAIKVRVA